MEFYFYIEPNSEKELDKFYEKLRTIEEITLDKFGLSTMQVHIKGNEKVPWKPSLLACCFRDDNESPWYNRTKIERSHWIIKFKKFFDFQEDDLIEIIKDTKLIYEDNYVLIVHYNFAINS